MSDDQPSKQEIGADDVGAFADICGRMSAEDFRLAFPHPFLIQVSGLSGQPDQSASFMTRENSGSGSVKVASLLECPVYRVKKRETGRFRDMITIGRARLNDIVVRHDKVSKLHAYFHQREGSWFVTDCESSNRTFVGGLELISNKPIPLTEREEIALSRRVTFLFRSPSAFYDQVRVFASSPMPQSSRG